MASGTGSQVPNDPSLSKETRQFLDRISRQSRERTVEQDVIEFLSAVIEVPVNQDYRLIVNLPEAITINSISTRSASGTCTATFKINTTDLGWGANSVSSSEVTVAHTTANAMVAGDDLVLTVSANSTCLRMSLTIKYTRTVSWVR